MKPLFHIDTLYHQYFYTNNAEYFANDCYKKIYVLLETYLKSLINIITYCISD